MCRSITFHFHFAQVSEVKSPGTAPHSVLPLVVILGPFGGQVVPMLFRHHLTPGVAHYAIFGLHFHFVRVSEVPSPFSCGVLRLRGPFWATV